MADGVGIVLLEAGDLRVPPPVRFHGEDDVRIGVADALEKRVGVPVLLQHVGDDDAHDRVAGEASALVTWTRASGVYG